jgi:hypothetical protein
MPLRGPNPLSAGHRPWLRGSIIPFRSRIIDGNSSPQRHKRHRGITVCVLCASMESLGGPGAQRDRLRGRRG